MPHAAVKQAWLLAQAPAAPEAQGTALFSLNFLWLEKNIAVAVDQVISEVGALCMTTCMQVHKIENCVSGRMPSSLSGREAICAHGCMVVWHAESAQPAHRVLLLAAEGRLGGAEILPGEQALGL